ncbi:UNKNOWN [Stylonychia lemnae]|uniref:Uncharacterized protein n=1 Tax=Stylonychia lemnae TaxID=5949 RepID=A0A077ZTV9_STYLE|nr:UNKNOWN [Stylonychia lemnae]|eukprot:CDW73328.1 UNKNOWN [Stylonychia lemnae]
MDLGIAILILGSNDDLEKDSESTIYELGEFLQPINKRQSPLIVQQSSYLSTKSSKNVSSVSPMNSSDLMNQALSIN